MDLEEIKMNLLTYKQQLQQVCFKFLRFEINLKFVDRSSN